MEEMFNETCCLRKHVEFSYSDDKYQSLIEVTTIQIQTLMILLGILVPLFYYCIYKPMNWTKDLSEIGYDYLWEENPKINGRLKRHLVQQARRRRKIGDLPPVYPNGWFSLMESSEVKPSRVKYVNALGEHFAVFRTKEGVIHILDAYCPHLGANMAVGGTVHGNCLECPFHGWKFSGENGKCVEVPYSTKVPSAAKVKKWFSCEVNGFIFVWYHAEGTEPTWQLQAIPQIENGKWWYRGRNEFYINSHIQEIPENGADVAHLNAIHAPSMLGGSDIRKYRKPWLNFTKHEWSAKWAACKEPGKEHTAVMNLTHKIKFFEKFTLINLDVTANQIGPGYVVLQINSTFGPMLLLQVVTPVEPMLQKIIHTVYCPPYLFLYGNLVVYGESVMVERDIMVWNHKKYIKKPLLVKEDKTIHLHRRWYSQFYSENSPQLKFQDNSMDW